jgi:transposase
VYFVDASHFVHAPFLGFLWCLVRLFVPGPSGRKRYSVLAALDAATRRVVRVATHGCVNALTACELLRAVAESAGKATVTLVLDNARYQKCALVRDLAKALKIELLYLPPYSPNLNLIERLWKFVKREALAARSLGDYEKFTGAIDDCLDSLGTRHKEQMETLLTLNFQLFGDETVLSA